VRDDVHVNVCKRCVEDILRRHLPQLVRTLEERYGGQLDLWLREGHFTSATWLVGQEFRVDDDRLRQFVTDIVGDAIRDETVALSLPRSDPWAPADIRSLAVALYERIGEDFQRLVTRQITESISLLPTEAAERELIETASGQRPAISPRRKEVTVTAAAFTSASPLPGPAMVLLDLRYRHDASGRPYTELWDGEVDPVWKEIAGQLLAEVAALIPEDESQWT
jgi:hypothetical protein